MQHSSLGPISLRDRWRCRELCLPFLRTLQYTDALCGQHRKFQRTKCYGTLKTWFYNIYLLINLLVSLLFTFSFLFFVMLVWVHIFLHVIRLIPVCRVGSPALLHTYKCPFSINKDHKIIVSCTVS